MYTLLICLSNFQNELKASFASRDKEINQRKKVDKVRQKNPNDTHQIVSFLFVSFISVGIILFQNGLFLILVNASYFAMQSRKIFVIYIFLIPIALNMFGFLL